MKNKKQLLSFQSVETTSKEIKPLPVVDRETFLQSLMKNLILAKNKFPQVYNWTEGTDVFLVFKRLVESLETDSYSRHCHAIKWTCKELKLKHDRETINNLFKKVG